MTYLKWFEQVMEELDKLLMFYEEAHMELRDGEPVVFFKDYDSGFTGGMVYAEKYRDELLSESAFESAKDILANARLGAKRCPRVEESAA